VYVKAEHLNWVVLRFDLVSRILELFEIIAGVAVAFTRMTETSSLRLVRNFAARLALLCPRWAETNNAREK
jgi:hypothetical protein